MAANGRLTTSGYQGRCLTFSWSTTGQSIEKNEKYIAWSLVGDGDAPSSWYESGNISVIIDGQLVYSQSDRLRLYKGTQVASGTHTLPADNNGNKTFSVTVQAGIYTFAVNCTGSKSFSIDPIPRCSDISAPRGTLEVPLTITVTKKVDSFKHAITYSCGTASGAVVEKTTDTSISWTPPLELAAQNTVGTTVDIKLTITTYSDSIAIGSKTVTVVCDIPTSVVPSCTVSVEDLTDTSSIYGGPVQNLSKLRVVASPAKAYNSPINSCAVTIDGRTYSTTEVTTDTLRSAGDAPIVVTVTDKRGRSYTHLHPMTVKEYQRPMVINFAAGRCTASGDDDPRGGYIKVLTMASISSMNNLNTASFTVKYRRHGDQTYSEIPLEQCNNQYFAFGTVCIFEADTTATYEVRLDAVDRHGSDFGTTPVPTAFTLINYGEDGESLAFGKISEKPGWIEVDMPIEFYKQVLMLPPTKTHLELASGVVIHHQESEAPWYKKSAEGLVELWGIVSPASDNNSIGSTSGTTICTLPEGYRPPNRIMQLCQGSGTATWTLVIEPDGTVLAARYRSGNSYVTPPPLELMPFHIIFSAEKEESNG